MSEKEIKITKDDVQKSGYIDIIDNCDKRECYRYSTEFLKKGRELESSNPRTSEIYILMGRIASLNLNPESTLNPFSPMPSGPLESEPENFVQIFSSDHLDLMRHFVKKIADNELKARISDVLWVIDRNHKMAELAIYSYLESSKTLEHPEHWTSCEKRIQRAFRLSNMLGKKSGHLEKVIKHIEDVLDKYNGEDPLFLSYKLMSMLIEANVGDPVKYSNFSEKCAIDAEKKNNFHRARAYWQTKAQWHKIQKDEIKERESNLKYADSYVKEAESRLKGKNGSYLVASTFLQKAIEAYRRISNTKDVVDKLHKKLIEYERESVNEMQRFSTDIDVTESVKNTIRNISDKSLLDALFALSLMVNSPNVDNLRKEVKELANKYVFQYIVSGVAVNKDGKVTARKASMFSNDPSEVEESIKQNMHQHAEFHRLIVAQSVIEPARHRINLDHNAILSDFMNIVNDNPFVPVGREHLFAQGLLSGLEGDYVIAAHILIPQIENTIRYILTQKGVVTSGMDSNGIQDERSLNSTLYTKEIEEVFGKDIVFDLQGLLVERMGANLRNRMAHGLMDYSSFFSIHVSYLWAITLRLCCWHIIVSKVKEDTSS